MEKKGFTSSLKLGKFKKFLNELGQDRKELVRSYEFGDILKFNCSEAPRSICFWLAKRFDVKTRTVNMDNGSSFAINAFTVHQILGIPLGGRKICSKPTREQRAIIAAATGTGSVAPTVEHLFSLLEHDLTGDQFIRVFMLITLAIFLCPTSYGGASAHYYSGIATVEDIPKYDWCSFVLDWLVDSIQRFQESTSKGIALGKNKTSSLGGCLFVLAVTYFEYIKTPNIILRDAIPRISIWDDHMIQQFLALDGNNGDGCSFGMLQLKDPSETPFVSSSMPGPCFSTLPCQVDDYILRLVPDVNVRGQLSTMCTGLYKELMQSCLCAMQPVLIKQMCKMVDIMLPGLSSNIGREVDRFDTPMCSHSTSEDINAVPSSNPMTHTNHQPAANDNDMVGYPDSSKTDHQPAASDNDVVGSSDAKTYGDKSGQLKTPVSNTQENTISMETIQCAQKCRYTYPESSSAVNDTHANWGGSAAKEDIQGKVTNAAEALEGLKNYGDDDDDILGAQIQNSSATMCKSANTPSDKDVSHAGSTCWYVPDSYERSRNAVRKVNATRLQSSNIREDVSSVNNGPSKKRRLLKASAHPVLDLQNQSDGIDDEGAHAAKNDDGNLSSKAQNVVQETEVLITKNTNSKIDGVILSENHQVCKIDGVIPSENHQVNSKIGPSSKGSVPLSKGTSSPIDVTSTMVSEEDEDVVQILSEKFTRRHAIRLPRALADSIR